MCTIGLLFFLLPFITSPPLPYRHLKVALLYPHPSIHTAPLSFLHISRSSLFLLFVVFLGWLVGLVHRSFEVFFFLSLSYRHISLQVGAMLVIFLSIVHIWGIGGDLHSRVINKYHGLVR